MPQPDQIRMAVFFWHLVKSDTSIIGWVDFHIFILTIEVKNYSIIRKHKIYISIDMVKKEEKICKRE